MKRIIKQKLDIKKDKPILSLR